MEAIPARLQVRTWGAGPRRILLLRGISSSADGWVVVLGHSLGGAVAVLASTRNPAWAIRLVLQDPALILADAPRAEIVRGLMECYDRLLTPEGVTEANPGWHPEDCRIKAEALRRSSFEMVRGTLEDNDPWNVLAEAAGFPCQMVLLGSDPATGVVFPVTIGEWLGAQPGVEYRMPSGAGHAAHREQAGYEMYLSAVLDALGFPEETTAGA